LLRPTSFRNLKVASPKPVNAMSRLYGLQPTPRTAVYSSDNYIWGCTGFDSDVCRLGEAGRDPGCHVKRRTNTSANDEFALAA